MRLPIRTLGISPVLTARYATMRLTPSNRATSDTVYVCRADSVFYKPYVNPL